MRFLTTPSDSSIGTPKHVIFSSRAFTAVLAETKEKASTETGGVFLGVMRGDTWFVIEAIDPGPKSIFESSYFEYDGDYVRHLANKVNRLYGDRLDVLGLWHRHPGSMDTFSSTDDGTNMEFAVQMGGACISAIVNIDPRFRLTMYAAALKPISLKKIGHKKISYEVDDSKIPGEVAHVLNHEEVERQINAAVSKKQVFPRVRVSLEKYLHDTEHYPASCSTLKNSEDDYNNLIDNYIVDECLYCDEAGIPYICDCSEKYEVRLIIGKKDSNLRFSFYMANEKQPCFVFEKNVYPYKGNLLKNVLENKQ